MTGVLYDVQDRTSDLLVQVLGVLWGGHLIFNAADNQSRSDINEKEAAKYPCDLEGGNWGPKRSPNGSIIGN